MLNISQALTVVGLDWGTIQWSEGHGRFSVVSSDLSRDPDYQLHTAECHRKLYAQTWSHMERERDFYSCHLQSNIYLGDVQIRYKVTKYNIYTFIHCLQYWIKHEVGLESPSCPRIIHALPSHLLLETSANKPCSLAYIDSSLIARSVSCNWCR